MKLKSLRALLIGALMIVCSGCVQEDPPIELQVIGVYEYRDGLAVSNLSATEHLSMRIYVTDKDGEYYRSYNVVANAGDTVCVSCDEMSWRLKTGDQGFVEVRGYDCKLYFEILSNGLYQTEFDD